MRACTVSNDSWTETWNNVSIYAFAIERLILYPECAKPNLSTRFFFLGHKHSLIYISHHLNCNQLFDGGCVTFAKFDCFSVRGMWWIVEHWNRSTCRLLHFIHGWNKRKWNTTVQCDYHFLNATAVQRSGTLWNYFIMCVVFLPSCEPCLFCLFCELTDSSFIYLFFLFGNSFSFLILYFLIF